VAVTGGGDGTVALWQLNDGGLIAAGDPQPSHGGYLGEIRAVAAGQLGGRPVAVSAKLRGCGCGGSATKD